jgi:hypothetical protein
MKLFLLYCTQLWDRARQVQPPVTGVVEGRGRGGWRGWREEGEGGGGGVALESCARPPTPPDHPPRLRAPPPTHLQNDGLKAPPIDINVTAVPFDVMACPNTVMAFPINVMVSPFNELVP